VRPGQEVEQRRLPAERQARDGGRERGQSAVSSTATKMICIDMTSPAPELPEEVVRMTSEKYEEALRRLTAST